jgi:hypothetical protein
MDPVLLSHAVDLVGVVLLAELLLALRRPAWLPRVAAGLGLWVALRLALSGGAPEAIAAGLLAAGVAHAIDRWLDGRALRGPGPAGAATAAMEATAAATPSATASASANAHGPRGPERLS